MKVTRNKNCYCHTCKKSFHYMGIARPRAGHKHRAERCKITFTYGDTYKWRYDLDDTKNCKANNE